MQLAMTWRWGRTFEVPNYTAAHHVIVGQVEAQSPHMLDDTELVGVVQAGYEVAEIEDELGVVDDAGRGVVRDTCAFIHGVGVVLGRQVSREEMDVIS
jgi:hypothetical protein